MPRIRVLLADDSAFARKTLVTMLRADSGIEVCGTAVDGADAVRLARELEPDVVVLDYHMPNQDGLSALRELMSGSAPLPVIMFSTEGAADGELARRALQEGAVCVLSKPAGPSVLVGGLRDLTGAAEELRDAIRRAYAQRGSLKTLGPVPDLD